MSNKDDDNEIDVTFKKIDDEEEEEEGIEEEEAEEVEEQVAPETLQIVEEHVVSIDPSSVIQEVEGEDMDGEDEDILIDTNDDDDDISKQQLKEQSIIQIEKLAQRIHTLQTHYDEIEHQFKSINDLQSQVKKLQVQIDDILKKTGSSKKRKLRKVKSKKASSSSSTKKIGKRNKKQRR
ncbi:MAG: hypothetical protein M3156_03485 [Thermoproteota archaeon]|nr:hypothetical protein [Thermoproteota archaeon]